MPKGPALRRSRGPYVTQACTICRAKKSKCDGEKPVCGSCAASGRDDECSWGRHTAWRKPRTEAHFEALRKRADSLQEYVDRLEAILGKCVCQDVSFHLQFRPQQLGVQSGTDGGDSDTDVFDSDEEITQELTVPTQYLKLDDRLGGLLLHGVTAPFRFGNRFPNEVARIPKVVENPDTAYVLQVDGVDISQSHPDIDWSRHLPPEVPMDRKQHDKILDLSFKFFAMWAFRVIPWFFLRDMYRALRIPRSEPPPRTVYYSPMLHNAVLSISASFSDHPHLRDPKTRHYFAIAAKSYLEAECKKPDISLMHSLAFIGTYFADLGDRIQGELFFGMSSRLSMTLGLGIDATALLKTGLINQDEMHGRNWAHWTLFSLDVSWAFYFGREFVGPPPLRRNIPLPHVNTEHDQLPWHHPSSNIPPQPNFLTLIFLESCKLVLIARQIVDVVNGLAGSARLDTIQVEEHVTKIDLELNNWKSQLPPHLDITPANKAKSTPQRLMLHLTYWWCFIILHRPFFNRRAQHSDREVNHVKLCTRAAENILELIETWSTLYTLRLTPGTALQPVFSVGTVFLLHALQATASPRIAHSALRTALAQVETCVCYLRGIGATWRAAARTADILQALLSDRLRPIIARRLAQRGEQIYGMGAPDVSSSSSSSSASSSGSDSAPHETPRLPWVPAPAPAPAYAAPEWNVVVQDPSWSQIPLDFFAPTQPTLQRSASGSYPLGVATGGDNAFPELNMTAFLQNFDYFGAPELWE
ncbi:hypothetical protein B0H19DRAFT_203041 [Mycena capillaripes]|nr:hypothetical protein B0H19DRAFT_203041 [Mycena capillaripes]